jgi:hypothetical protein
LMHVEKASKVRRVFLLFVLTVDKVRTRLKWFYFLFDVILQGTDLSPVTDKLWKKFFEKQFGVDRTNEVIWDHVRKKSIIQMVAIVWGILFTCFVSSFQAQLCFRTNRSINYM